MKKISVLGATGSIGKSALDIISRNKDKFEVALLSAFSNRHELEKLKQQWPSAVCLLAGEENGTEKLLAAITETKADITINGISGAAGLEPSIAAIQSGSNLALANKETIVMAGELVFRLAKKNNVKIIPVDSEHSAIFHLIEAHIRRSEESDNNKTTEFHRGEENIRNQTPNSSVPSVVKNSSFLSEIILTASGGPFRKLSLKEMERVTPEDALAHPTWKMGPKITIDSASMANKGLEIIEACLFFNMPPEKIQVVIHPQSIVHSMIKLCNGVIYAQLSKPDMRHPIHDALFWPDTFPLNIDPLNFDSLTLEFEKPDLEKFPMLTLAWEAARLGKLYPCAYNAANEEAVAAFLKKQIGFFDIPRITASVLESDWSGGHAYDCSNLQTILEADANALSKAKSCIKGRF